MALLIMGGIIFLFGLVMKLVPTVHNKDDERVIAYNKMLDPVMTVMMAVGGVLIAAGVIVVMA